MRIAIPDDYQDAVRDLDALSILSGHQVDIYTDLVKNIDHLAARLKHADVLVPIRERSIIDEALLSRLPNLRLISQTGKGVTHIDIEACTRRGIAVAASGGSSYAPAELTWALVLASARRLPQEVANARAGKWQRETIGTSLRGRTLGILGYGSIGKIVAGYGKAFGMRVLIWGREGSLSRAADDGFEAAESKEDFFRRSDVLTVHLRLNAETRWGISAADLASMKPTATLVNTSRADLIETGALAAALQAGRPGFAAVDAYEEEPAIEHPLFSMRNVVCSPHLGYVEKDTYEIFFGGAFDNVIAFEKGAPTNLINPDVLTTTGGRQA
ncbi:D-2-hydroxyacid dehydrogenase family protein [Paraburkholderia sabiae]|uniref:D-2-hydroxyacid dehydrogenase family protein n=1 Tax=Paraburkholderia sabiae TaxID=273251 RepID=A0ABU9QK81_9BURK|nr:D-2-hydroxyacid dehydrogenase family protein [Paraburkholderia sabiae]WJZ77074.1 D-2-hydroxyacid dehydrogenase family protein [Paraburkholderia sabiae]